MSFKPKTVYTVKEGILFVPTVKSYKPTVGVSDRFIVADPPRWRNLRGEGGTHWFKLINDDIHTNCIFGIRPRYAEHIVEAT